MNTAINYFEQKDIEKRIFTIRNVQVMLDSHLAEMYGVETKNLNRAVKRNENRFPESFRFQLTKEELETIYSQIEFSTDLRFQNGTSSLEHGGRRYFPYVFTEQGVAMLSGILRSDMAVQISIRIMTAFVEMRKLISSYSGLFQRMNHVERKQVETDEKFEQVFKALESDTLKKESGIFFDGQVFDAYNFIADLIRSAESSIQLIDNYVNDSVLLLMNKRKKGVVVTIYTKSPSATFKLDVEKYNEQFECIYLKEIENAHDRFLIIDEKSMYHIGASLKDLGKKWFAFSKIDKETISILDKLND